MRSFFLLFLPIPLELAAVRPLLADDPYIGPYIQALEQDSVTILWETDSPAVGEVEIGENGDGKKLLFIVREAEMRTIHNVPVGGLASDTRYFYRVRWDGKFSDRFSFRTRPPEGTRHFRIAAYGDSRSNPPAHTEIVRRMVEFEPDVVLHTGDLVADGTKKEHWKPQFFDPLRPLAAQAPVIPCMGNHENNSGLYYQYFNRADGESWFSYRWANVHFLVLDSQKPVKSGTEQFHWLEKELATPKPDWRIVFCHYPMFSCHPTRDVNENRWAWQDLFDRTGVDLVLTGHDHYYHRTHRIGRAWDPTSRGVYHITTAGGGASLYPVEQKIYTAKAESVHHFMILDIDGKRLEGEVLSVDGKLIDTFTIDRAAPEQTPFVSYEMVQWEKALNEAIDPIQPEAIGAGEGRIERKVKLPALSGYDASISVRWTGGSSFWAADLCESIVPTVPDKPFEVAIWGEGSPQAMYPLPRLELTPVRGPAAAKAFVNPSIVLHPLRVSTNRLLRAPKLSTEVKVDGKLDDAAWSRAAIANGFTRDFGTIRSGREAFQVGYDDKGILVAARIRSLIEKPKDQGAKDKDTRHMYRTDESVSIILSPPTLRQVYFFFCGNSRGTRFDSLSNVIPWNPDWEFATADSENGWQAEARIPWIALGLQGPPHDVWRVNLFHWDARDKALSEWTATYSSLGTARKFDAEIEFVPVP